MLNHEIQRDAGILVLRPDGPLEAADFQTLTTHVDAYLENSGLLHGVLIIAPQFPGWHSFSALVAHLRFVKNHHQRVEKIAVVADGALATVMPLLARHFLHAEVKQFEPAQEDLARNWLRASGRPAMRSAA